MILRRDVMDTNGKKDFICRDSSTKVYVSQNFKVLFSDLYYFLLTLRQRNVNSYMFRIFFDIGYTGK